MLTPRPAQEDAFVALLPHLPEPEAFAPLLQGVRDSVMREQAAGRLVLVGEIGLDAFARVRIRPTHSAANDAEGAQTPAEAVLGLRNRLSPFKTTLSHQAAIARLQLDIAITLAVPASIHCVNAPGATLDLLQRARAHHGPASFARTNICIHSCGGMSPAFLAQTARALPNAFFSPSVSVTARSGAARAVVGVVPRERLLVESDAPDVRAVTHLVWAAAAWIAECRGWRLEGAETAEWEPGVEDEDEVFDEKGRVRALREDEVWAVRMLERNWARFMGMDV